MKIKIVFFLCLLQGAVLAQETQLSASEAKQFKDKAESKAASITSLQTDFTQFKHMEFLSDPIETSGEMLFLEPNRLRWEYTTPYSYSIIFKNNKVHINDAGKKSAMDVGNSKTFEKINQLLIGSVSGDVFDEEAFEIRYYQSEKFYIAKLKPKDQSVAKYINEMHLFFSKKSFLVEEVLLIEPNEDFTKIVFSNKTLNSSLDASDFSH